MTTAPAVAIMPAAGAGLSVEAIERTLRDLWRDIDDAQTKLTQVRTLNLIVYLAEPPSSQTRQMIQAVAIRHPGRTIILQPDDGPPRAEPTIACRTGDDGRQACGEQITLLGSAGGHALHSFAIGLLQPGLPVTVWWHGPADFDSQLFGRLVKVADRLILDSRTWDDPLAVLPKLLEASRRWNPNLRVSDLQWVELTSWRRLLAHAFDVPDACALLPTLSEVVIEAGGAALSAAPLLLAGWLASRLDWEIDAAAAVRDETGYVFPLRRAGSDDARVILAIRRRNTPESICAVEIRASGDPPAHFSFTIIPDRHHTETRIELHGNAPLVQVINLRERDAAGLLGEELALMTADSVYVAALAAAVRLVQSIQAIR